MSMRAALRPFNKDAAPARIMRKDTKPRKGVGKDLMVLPPWKFTRHSSATREADLRSFRGSITRGMQPKVFGQRYPYPRPPPAPAPTPRTVTPQSANNKRRPPYDFTQQRVIHEIRQFSTLSPPFTRRIVKASANPAKRLCLSATDKGKKKDADNENYPDAMKSAENSTTSLIETMWKSNKSNKSYSWGMLQARRDDNFASYIPQAVSYQSVPRKHRRCGDGWEMEKSVWEDDPATIGSLCRRIIAPVSHEMGVVTPGRKTGKFTQKGVSNNCGIVNETPAKIARYPKAVSSNSSHSKDQRKLKKFGMQRDIVPSELKTHLRLIDPLAARRSRIGSKADVMKATASENATPGRCGSVIRRDKAAIKIMENNNRSVFRRIPTPFQPCNLTASSKKSLYPEEGLKKRQCKTSLKEQLMPFLLPAIPECKPSEEISQNSALRSLGPWKEWARNNDSRMSQATKVAVSATKDRAQEIGQMSAKEASRTVSEKIRSTFVKQINLPLRGTGGRPRKRSSHCNAQYPKELMSASDSETESKMKYYSGGSGYFNRNTSLPRGHKFRPYSTFNISLPGSSADVYPWCMSNYEPLGISKRTI